MSDRKTSSSEHDDIPTLREMIQAFLQSGHKPFNDRNLKCWGKMEKWFSTSLVLSMESYVHTTYKSCQRGTFIQKHAVTLEIPYAHSRTDTSQQAHIT